MNTRIFINEVKERRSLWDSNDQDYHNKRVLNELWSEVASLFDIEVLAAKQKWKNLRDTFRVELKKKKKFSGNPEHRNSWTFYEDMIFLKDVLKTRKLRDLLEPTKSTSFNDDAEGEEQTEADAVDNTPIKVEPETLYSPSHMTDDTFTENDDDNNTAGDNGTAFRPQIQDIDTTHSKLTKRGVKRKSEQDDTLESEEQDDDLLFFRSLLPFVKKLDQDKKLLFRMNVQQMLYNQLYN